MFQSLSESERSIMRQLGQAAGGGMGRGGGVGGGGGMPAAQSSSSVNAALLGGNYLVFVMRDGVPTVTRIETGLTDLDYSEIVSGLTPTDTVLILPSGSLLASQQEMQERLERMTSGMPGAPGGGPRR
jgi:hypothetical protein